MESTAMMGRQLLVGKQRVTYAEKKRRRSAVNSTYRCGAWRKAILIVNDGSHCALSEDGRYKLMPVVLIAPECHKQIATTNRSGIRTDLSDPEFPR
jgi:ferric-dicitrate binding protein FerR (iron transport regulator)